MSERVECELCGREVDVHESYVVRVEVFADPSVPPVSGEARQRVEDGSRGKGPLPPPPARDAGFVPV